MKNKTRIIAQWEKGSISESEAKCLQELTMEYIPQVGDHVIVDDFDIPQPLKIIMVVHNLEKNTVDLIVNYKVGSQRNTSFYNSIIDR
jgi:hypothetical protein